MSVGYTLSFKDRDNEGKTTTIRGADLTSANYDAQVALAEAVRDAILDVTTLALSNEKLTALDVGYSVTLPTSPWAQRGIQWLVRGLDTLGNEQHFHIGGANLGLAGILDGEKMDLTSTEGAALEAAINAYWRSNANLAVTVTEIVYVD